MKKPIFKRGWFWLLIVVFAIMAAVNILFSCLFPESHANIFTAVSGWVSGIATAALGIIAVLQNERYEKDNQIYLDKQQEIQQQIAETNKKQNNFSKRMSDFNELSEYFRSISDDLYKLFSENISTVLKETIFDAYELRYNNHIGALNRIDVYTDNLGMRITTIISKIRMCNYSFSKRNELMIALLSIRDCLFVFNKYIKQAPNWEYLQCNLPDDINKLQDLCFDAMELMKQFLVSIQKVQNFVRNDSNSDEDCQIIIKKLVEKRKKDDIEFNNYLEERIKTEEDNGQAENGN